MIRIMKTTVKIVLWSMLIAGISSLTLTVRAQDVKMSKQDRKEARRILMETNFKTLDTLLDRRNFVLEANYLQDNEGRRVVVTPLLNFIRVDTTMGVLQTGASFSSGYNGVGGVTAEGKITNWNLTKDFRNSSYFLRFSLVSNIGNFDISMIINAGNFAQATITSLSYGRFTWVGHLQPVYNSIIFKGQNSN
jgi:hypothetical protein